MTTARESAQKISSDLTSRIDMQIRAMAKRGVKVASSLTGKKYDDQPIILDSVRQLESYKQELMNKRMLQLRAAGVKEDELERAASNYISRALSGVIFGVRMSRE
jgi:ribosomal protein L22